MTPESDIIAKTAVNIITELFKVSLKGMAAFSNWLKEANTTHDVLGISAEKYVKKLEDRYSEVRIIGMTKPVKLRNIYVKVNILDSKSSVQSLSVKQLEEIFYKEGKIKSFIEKDDDNENNERINQIKYIRETLPGLDIVNSHDRVFLIGKPGSGKTTFLKYLTLASLDNKLSKKKIPIYISLKDYADSGKNIIDFIVDQFDICDFPNAFLFVENIIKNGNCLILFDGLDEAIEQDERIITSLNQFIDKYLKNKFVISCRIAASNYVFEKFTEVEISDFDKIQIRQFINNWFESDAYKAELCWIEISSNDENKRILELASTPLLLTLICISFESLLSFPSNKAEIYKDALDVLLKRWDSSRNIKRSEIYKELSLRKKETLLSQIAFKTFSKNDYFFRRITIEKHIQDFILNLNNINVNEIEFDSQRILMAVEAQHGLIVERAKDIFSFSHLTLQEYFTAKYFIDNLMRENVANVMNENILNPRWKEVFLIAACMLNEADEFLLKMQNEILKKFSEVNFNYFMETIFCVIRTDTFFPIEIKKCLALYYVLDLDQVRESAIRDNLQLTKIRTNILALTNAISKSYSKKESYSPVISLWEHISDDNMIKFANDLNKAINFNSTIIVERGKSLKLNKSLVELLNNYIQSNKTLVDCLNSDCYLSNETKLLIHSRLLNEKYIS